MEKFLCGALFGAFLGVIVAILFLKLWKTEERVTERGRRRLSGFNNPPEKQPVENDERPAKMPQEHEERFLIKCEYKFISQKLVSRHLGRQVNIE